MPETRRKKARRCPERAPLGSTPKESTGDLRAEIALVRGILRQIQEQMEVEKEGEKGGLSLAGLLRVADVLSRASSRLANLLRAQRDLDEDRDAGSALNQALDEVNQDLARD